MGRDDASGNPVALNVAVCVKQIPGPDEPPAFDPVTRTLVRDGALVFDESDAHGVELALRLVEQHGDGSVVLLSMAPRGELSGLKTPLAMGADRGVVISDPLLAGTDALGTAKVLAAAIARSGAQLVLAATESADGYTGTVPVAIAELLRWPAISFVNHLELTADDLVAHRQTDAGYDEVHCALPAVISVTAGSVEPRYPTLRGIMGAKSKSIELLTVADLGLDPGAVGVRGARQEVIAIDDAPQRERGRMIVDDGSSHEEIIAALESWKLI